jgi:hypothetical protein
MNKIDSKYIIIIKEKIAMDIINGTLRLNLKQKRPPYGSLFHKLSIKSSITFSFLIFYYRLFYRFF